MAFVMQNGDGSLSAIRPPGFGSSASASSATSTSSGSARASCTTPARAASYAASGSAASSSSVGGTRVALPSHQTPMQTATPEAIPRTRVVYRYGRSHHEFSRKSGVIRLRTGYAKEWYVNDKLHRENDLPAIVHANGDKEWFVHGLRHRDNDLPAVVDVNGGREWYVHGNLHRDVGDQDVWILPAVELANGGKQWWIHGCRIGSSCVRANVQHALALPSIKRIENNHWASLIHATDEEWMTFCSDDSVAKDVGVYE